MAFEKRKNAIFQVMSTLYNTALMEKRALDMDEIKRAFCDAPYEQTDIETFLESFMREDELGDEECARVGFGLFTKDKGGYRPIIGALIPAVFSHNEIAWLKTMLADEKIGLFLTDSTRQKLAEAFADIPPLYDKSDVFVQKNAAVQPFADETFRQVFQTLLRGVAEKRLVNLEYVGGKGEKLLHPAVLPLKIYYHGVNDTFQCIAYDTLRDRFPTLNIEGIRIAALIPDSTQNAHRWHYLGETETAEIELKNNKHGSTQCFLLLSDYQKEVAFDKTRNLYKISIIYYVFERQDLFKNLLSLGTHCTILSPEILVNQVKERIKKTESWGIEIG